MWRNSWICFLYYIQALHYGTYDFPKLCTGKLQKVANAESDLILGPGVSILLVQLGNYVLDNRLSKRDRHAACSTDRGHGVTKVLCGTFRRIYQAIKVKPIYQAPAAKSILASTIDYRCADGRFQQSACGVTILNNRSVSSSETGVIETGWKAGKHTHFHQLNSRKLLTVFNTAKSEGLQLYSQI